MCLRNFPPLCCRSALGNELTASRAFTSLTLFTLLRVPLFMLPHLISQIINTMVGLDRMREFLAAEEQPGLELLPVAKPGGILPPTPPPPSSPFCCGAHACGRGCSCWALH